MTMLWDVFQGPEVSINQAFVAPPRDADPNAKNLTLHRVRVRCQARLLSSHATYLSRLSQSASSGTLPTENVPNVFQCLGL